MKFSLTRRKEINMTPHIRLIITIPQIIKRKQMQALKPDTEVKSSMPGSMTKILTRIQPTISFLRRTEPFRSPEEEQI